MFSNTGAEVSSQALRNLQGNLISLSGNLQDLYEILSEAMVSLHEDWQDEKFEEFEAEFRPSLALIRELSDKYGEWANGYLPPRIEAVEEIENSRMSIK